MKQCSKATSSGSACDKVRFFFTKLHFAMVVTQNCPLCTMRTNVGILEGSYAGEMTLSNAKRTLR